MSDKKGKLFGKINLIDFLVILLILAAFGGVAYKIAKSNILTPFEKPDKIEMKFTMEELPDYVAKALSEGLGSTVKDTVQNSVLGKVTHVKVENSRSYASNEKGVIVQSSKPGYNSVLMTIEGEGKFEKEGAVFGTGTYPVGRTMELRVGNVAIYGRIQSLLKKG